MFFLAGLLLLIAFDIKVMRQNDVDQCRSDLGGRSTNQEGYREWLSMRHPKLAGAILIGYLQEIYIG